MREGLEFERGFLSFGKKQWSKVYGFWASMAGAK